MPLSSFPTLFRLAAILSIVAFGFAVQPNRSAAATAHGSKTKCSTKKSSKHATSRSTKRSVRCTKRTTKRSIKRSTRIVAGPRFLSLGIADAAAESLVATEDAYVNSSSPTKNFGSNEALRLDTKPGKRSYVKFDVPAGAAPVTQAVLMVYATSSSREGVVARRFTNPDVWSDWSITWNNRPTASSTTLAASGRYSSGAWISLDVTSAVTAGAKASFELTTPSNNQTTFASSEAGVINAPQLKITRASIAPPPDTTAPSAPASLTATAGNAQAQLAWNAASDNVAVTGYQVSRNGTLVASTTGTSWTDTAVSNGTSYSYTVKAIDAAGNLSAASNTATATPVAPADTTAPSAPASLTATAGNTQAQVAWNAASDNVAVTGYRVYRNGTQVASPTGTSWTNTGLTNGTSYSYTVKAIDAAGNLSAVSNTASATPVAPGDTTAPSAPASLTATAGNGQVQVAWNAATDNVAVTGYRVYRGSTLVASPTGTSWTNTGLTNGTSYSYTVKAIDAAGNLSAASNTATATPVAPADTTAPSAPASLTATAGNGQVQVAWNAATDNVAVTGYRVYRGSTLVASPTGTSWTNTGLTNGTSYSYTVKAIDAAGNLSAASNTATATPVAPADTTAPSAPASLTATAGNGQVQVAWNAATDNVAVTGYRVYRGSTLVASPTGTSWTNTGLTNGTSYSYTVKAIDAAGNLSAASNTASATPVAPTGGGPNGAGILPYSPLSPWNTKIPAGVAVDAAKTSSYVGGLQALGLPLTSDPDQYTIPVVSATSSTPLVKVYASGTGDYMPNDTVPRKAQGSYVMAPIPAGALGGEGSDGQLEVVNWDTGEQWGFWQLYPNGDGTYTTSNTYHTSIGAGSMGRFADGQRGRGAGTQYLAGLVRPWEIAQGRIDHALAFACGISSPAVVYPASKSDGAGSPALIPEGTRLQLDPNWDINQLSNPKARIIAKALQDYGMYNIDNSGSSKIYIEDRTTANWDSSVTRSLVSGIPWSAFRVVAPPAQP